MSPKLKTAPVISARKNSLSPQAAWNTVGMVIPPNRDSASNRTPNVYRPNGAPPGLPQRFTRTSASRPFGSRRSSAASVSSPNCQVATAVPVCSPRLQDACRNAVGISTISPARRP